MSVVGAAPGLIEEQRQYLANLMSESASLVTHARNQVVEIRDAIDYFQTVLLSDDQVEVVGPLWEFVQRSTRTLVALRFSQQRHLAGFKRVFWFWSDVRECISTTDALLERYTELMRVVLMCRTELNLTLSADLETVVWTVRIPPLAYLRAMWNLFWSAIRRPLSETTIDLSTGRVLYRT